MEARGRLWEEACHDPLFLEDLDEVEATFDPLMRRRPGSSANAAGPSPRSEQRYPDLYSTQPDVLIGYVTSVAHYTCSEADLHLSGIVGTVMSAVYELWDVESGTGSSARFRVGCATRCTRIPN